MLLALPVAALGLAGCRDNTVQLTFRPAVGTVYRYDVVVHSVTDTEIEGAAPEHKDTRVELTAVHTVLERGPDGVLVRVAVGEAGAPPAEFLVRFDQAAQVRSVQPAAGNAATSLGLPEIFPAAAGAPPRRRLAPGARWSIDDQVRLPGGDQTTHLRGRGHLVALRRDGSRRIARLATDATMRLLTTSLGTGGSLVLDGEQRLRQQSSYDLEDGALWQATTVTAGTFAITVRPPGQTTGDGVPGTSRVRVMSTTTRTTG
ncbi:MAG: hypothetical protein JF603_04175 [Acidobacteria bacterium]|nr:hypothetical protein [Acidobacteriota bacterium]